MVIPRLTGQPDSLDKHEGCVEFEDANNEWVLMSIEAFRGMMDVGTDRDFLLFVAALRHSYEQFAKGHAS
ncbi:MAG TPA: hypothetical protein VEI07_18230 [Planctomycetaceae bacterium]|nr:hypothetical protein [Planctomycetaceae bacterium]